jgi:hypothetical protein
MVLSTRRSARSLAFCLILPSIADWEKPITGKLISPIIMIFFIWLFYEDQRKSIQKPGSSATQWILKTP